MAHPDDDDQRGDAGVIQLGAERRGGAGRQPAYQHGSAAAVPAAAPVEDDRRPSYRLADGPANVRWLRTQLGTDDLPGVFLRGGALAYVASVTEQGYIRPRHAEDDHGPATVTPLTALALSTRVGDRYRVEKTDRRSPMPRPDHFPVEDCRRVIETPDELPFVRPLRGVTHTPVARAERGLLCAPGYDEESRYLHEPTVDVGEVDTAPSAERVAAATAFLRGLVADFRWGDADSEAGFWGAMLTPLLRLACPPPYKLVGITARERGSGKSMLAELLRIVHGGSLSTWPSNDDELEKFISSTLHCTTAPIVQVDNVRGVLQSGRLEALATSSSYAVRVLGSTNRTVLANDRLWVFTGNNMIIGGDLGRRLVWCDIDPGEPHPERRSGFTIPDLPRHVRFHRDKVLRELLVWIAAWDAAGRPVGEATSDNYGRWSATVRSILGMAGVPGVFDNPEAERGAAANPDEVEWGDFLRAVREHFGSGQWTTRRLTDAMSLGGGEGAAELLDTLPAELHDKASRPGGPAGIRRSLGKWLGNRAGQWHAGHTARQVGVESKTKNALWSVVHEDDQLPLTSG